MASSKNTARAAVFFLLAAVLALLCAFFIFYTARLLYVTGWLTGVRAGGRGAYLGAIAFPVLALLFGLGSWRCVRAARRA
jgi:hypothetical protein